MDLNGKETTVGVKGRPGSKGIYISGLVRMGPVPLAGSHVTVMRVMERQEPSCPAVLLLWTASHPPHEVTWTFSLFMPQHIARNRVRLHWFGVIERGLGAIWGVTHPTYTLSGCSVSSCSLVFVLIHPGSATSLPIPGVQARVRLLKRTRLWRPVEQGG